MTTVGFDRPLYILPFDHHGSFQTKMFGWNGALSRGFHSDRLAAAAQELPGKR